MFVIPEEVNRNLHVATMPYEETLAIDFHSEGRKKKGLKEILSALRLL